MKSTGRKTHKLIAKALTIVISAALMITALPVTGSFGGPEEPFAVNAASQDGVYRKLISLQQKFPDGKYWNHVVPASEAGVNCSNEAYADSVTDTPCAVHGGNVGEGAYDCSYFDGGLQCCGFARKVFYDVFGIRESTLQDNAVKGYSGLSVGDFVRFSGFEHYAVVLSISDPTFTVVECNLDGYGAQNNCIISWGRTYELSQIAYYVHSTNYDSVNRVCTEHKWDKGTVTVKAKHTKTELADGEKTYTCTVCGEQKTEVIKAAHTYGPSTVKKATLSANGSITKKCGKCGKTVTTVIARPKTIKLKQSLVAYNGKAQKPGVLVTDSAGRPVPGASYSVSYLNNVKIGKAKAIVTFRGRYSGARILSFTIGPVGAAISKIAGGINKITVRWTRRSGVDGYQIQYATRSDFRDKKTVTIKGNKLSAKAISGLRGGTTYYARVRTYRTIKKTTYYSPWSKVVSATAVKGTAEDSAGTNMSYVIKYLRSGDVAKVRAYNKKLPATINESCVSSMSGDMKAAYKKEIQAWENRQTDYGNYYFDDYWLTDLDNDGTAEMLLALWPDSAGAQTIAYKYVNGGLKKLGSVGGMASCHAYPKHNGIVVEYGKMGYNQFTLVTYAGGKLKQEKLRLFDFTSGESYIGLRNNLKSHSNWNGERYVPDYTDLN